MENATITLFATLRERRRPEDIAQHLLNAAVFGLTPNSLQRSAHGYTSMQETYTAPIGAARQTAKTAELFHVPLLTDAECDDSTTWNNLASAWNKARSGYFAVLYALGMENVLDAICPGKVLRLMAADVARWQAQSGNGLHPDVAVWHDVPLPWQVMTGTASCTCETIRRVCARHGVNPETSGWTAPRPSARATVFRPTPELVHGIAAGHPYLAKVLRDAGYFSGKPARSF